MEQASQMRDVRAIYEPRIDITYSSDTRLFTIEDNGIGINEYDLEHFIAQIGAKVGRVWRSMLRESSLCLLVMRVFALWQ